MEKMLEFEDHHNHEIEITMHAHLTSNFLCIGQEKKVGGGFLSQPERLDVIVKAALDLEKGST